MLGDKFGLFMLTFKFGNELLITCTGVEAACFEVLCNSVYVLDCSSVLGSSNPLKFKVGSEGKWKRWKSSSSVCDCAGDTGHVKRHLSRARLLLSYLGNRMAMRKRNDTGHNSLTM